VYFIAFNVLTCYLLPCDTKFLWEFNFAIANKTGFSGWELIFAIFWGSRSNGSDKIFVFYLSTCNRNADKTTWECKHVISTVE